MRSMLARKKAQGKSSDCAKIALVCSDSANLINTCSYKLHWSNLPVKAGGSWLAKYVQEFGRQKSDDRELLLVTYKFVDKPNRMFYYRLEHLLTAVNGRRAQKSVIIVPQRAFQLIETLCHEYKGKIFAAKFGGQLLGD